MGVELPPGTVSLDARLQRLEDNDREILSQLRTLATVHEVATLRGKLEHIESEGTAQARDALTEVRALNQRTLTLERTYVSRSAIFVMATFIGVQFLTVVGLALGLFYELLNHK